MMIMMKLLAALFIVSCASAFVPTQRRSNGLAVLKSKSKLKIQNARGIFLIERIFIFKWATFPMA
jgi:hypothetical protein